MSGPEDQRRRLQERLRQLEQERAAIEAELAGIPADGVREISGTQSTALPARQDQAFDNRAKVELFRGLFRGRTDILALRWENLKTGKSGYAPACANEWKRGLCEKPRIKCWGLSSSGTENLHKADFSSRQRWQRDSYPR